MDINNNVNNMGNMGNSCNIGCNKCNNPCRKCDGNCEAIKNQIRAVCFALDETILYLDAYPDSQEALCYYHTLLHERNKLISEYEANCGPLSAYGNTSHTSWDWIKSPWPWTYEANM